MVHDDARVEETCVLWHGEADAVIDYDCREWGAVDDWCWGVHLVFGKLSGVSAAIVSLAQEGGGWTAYIELRAVKTRDIW